MWSLRGRVNSQDASSVRLSGEKLVYAKEGGVRAGSTHAVRVTTWVMSGGEVM